MDGIAVQRTFRRGRDALLVLFCLFASGCGDTPSTNTATVAVAANFLSAAGELVADFESNSQYTVKLVSASTGALYAQIKNGAPFDVLLAADQERPRRLESEGLAVTGSRFVYALGALSLCSRDAELPLIDGASELQGDFSGRLAIANPAVAPYGVAAEEVLAALQLADRLSQSLVKAESVAQAYVMVATGNVDYGFVARASVINDPVRNPASCWSVPASLHSPLRQEAVLLKRAADNKAAVAFVRYLAGPDAELIIKRHGYDIER